MKAFTIENETNNIMIHASAKNAEAVENAVSFRNEAGLAKLAADWPMARLIEIWNSLPGVTPVRKFTDRNTAARRIWAQVQNLGEPTPTAPVEETAAPTIPDTEPTASDVAPVETEPSEGRPPRLRQQRRRNPRKSVRAARPGSCLRCCAARAELLPRN